MRKPLSYDTTKLGEDRQSIAMENVSENNGIGSVLRAAREAQNVSLDDVSALLKIRSDHLQALENEDFDRLPGHVYAIGFIRTYATHLDLNAAELVTLFKNATQIAPVDDPTYNDASAGEPVSLALKLGLGVFAVFLVYLMWLIAGGAGTQNNPAQRAAVPQAPVDKQIATPAQRPAAPVPADGATAQNAAPSSEQAETASADTAQAADGEPVQALGLPEQISVTNLAAPTQTQAEAPEPPAVASRRVEIKASRRTWMRIESAEGRVLFSSIIREGEGFALEQDAVYTLATRDAGALHYHVDDAKVGNVGRRGQILTARKIDRAAIIALKP